MQVRLDQRQNLESLCLVHDEARASNQHEQERILDHLRKSRLLPADHPSGPCSGVFFGGVRHGLRNAAGGVGGGGPTLITGASVL